MAKEPQRSSWIVGKEECSAGMKTGNPPFNSETKKMEKERVMERESDGERERE